MTGLIRLPPLTPNVSPVLVSTSSPLRNPVPHDIRREPGLGYSSKGNPLGKRFVRSPSKLFAHSIEPCEVYRVTPCPPVAYRFLNAPAMLAGKVLGPRFCTRCVLIRQSLIFLLVQLLKRLPVPEKSQAAVPHPDSRKRL